ncbi:hypothetical protein B0H11DRAFT_1949251 [Mycena galericulata]|nr:hypothetical protein B0H11DRAFT_2069392 [Mycena galericulata]KAJ7513280.1 hypothetical protein B0H11DRAFT_1949251 [Mycena galericulata]
MSSLVSCAGVPRNLISLGLLLHSSGFQCQHILNATPQSNDLPHIKATPTDRLFYRQPSAPHQFSEPSECRRGPPRTLTLFIYEGSPKSPK